MNFSGIVGATILILEDDPLIGLDLAFLLEDDGAGILGPYMTSGQALEAIGSYDEATTIACAILDYELGAGTSEAVALALHARHAPVVFYTGAGARASALAREIDGLVVEKPSRPTDLLRTIADRVATAFRD